MAELNSTDATTREPPRPAAPAPRRELRLRDDLARDRPRPLRRRRAATEPDAGGCCGATPRSSPTSRPSSSAPRLYADDERDELPDTALLASLGCGNPTAMAELHAGETVLDLGSGGGIDVLLSARRVGPTGTAYGLDMTDEMLDLARANQAQGRRRRTSTWLKGHIEDIPLPTTRVDVVLSNCVINLSTDKPRSCARPRACSSPAAASPSPTSIADPEMDEATRADLAAVRRLHRRRPHARGIRPPPRRRRPRRRRDPETHRVHEHAASAIIRARRSA